MLSIYFDTLLPFMLTFNPVSPAFPRQSGHLLSCHWLPRSPSSGCRPHNTGTQGSRGSPRLCYDRLRDTRFCVTFADPCFRVTLNPACYRLRVQVTVLHKAPRHINVRLTFLVCFSRGRYRKLGIDVRPRYDDADRTLPVFRFLYGGYDLFRVNPFIKRAAAVR